MGLDRLPQTCELPMVQRISSPRGACQSSRQPWIRCGSQVPFAANTSLFTDFVRGQILLPPDWAVTYLDFSHDQVPFSQISKLVRLNWKKSSGTLQLCRQSAAFGPFGSSSMFFAVQFATTPVAVFMLRNLISPCDPPLDPFTVMSAGL